MTTCDCVEGCQLADRFTPATREILVFTKSAKRYFDLDAVRTEPLHGWTSRLTNGETGRLGTKGLNADRGDLGAGNFDTHPAGAPPLDWWQIPSPKPQPVTEYQGAPMTATFYVGDAIETMNKLPEKSVDLILTSPPFLALRSYLPADHPDKALEGGSQATPGMFIDWLIDVVEACDRVLAPHGSLCIELGDTYAGSGGAGGDYQEEGLRTGQPVFAGSARRNAGADTKNTGNTSRGTSAGGAWPLAKSLSLIPELFRLTLVYGTNPLTGRTTDRWRLRNVVRWVRPNPPVGALGDKFRPATSELMVFCKSAKRYFDLDAVREPQKWADHVAKYPMSGYLDAGKGSAGSIRSGGGHANPLNPAGAPPLDWWNIPLLEGEEPTKGGPKTKGYDPEQRRQATPQTRTQRWNELGIRGKDGFRNEGNPLGAPPLDWWNIPPGGYEGAHYAVFPPELCVKPVKAMCPEKVCRQCGEPSRRIVEKSPEYQAFRDRQLARIAVGATTERDQAIWPTGFTNAGTAMNSEYVTLGFSDCGHDDWRPGLVLDPFGGSGTTALVATGHGRDAILIDLDERNFDLALQRVGPFILQRGAL